jgi:hypothetical protein
MAEEVQIPGTTSTAKLRTPWVVLLLAFVTLGIYTWFWWYFINRELADLGRARGTSELGTTPILSALAYSLGSLVYVPLIWTIVTTSRRIQAGQRMLGNQTLNGWLAAMLWVFTLGIGGIVYTQSEMNTLWRMEQWRQGGGAPATGAVVDPQTAQLTKLEQLRDTGALSGEEFEAQRARLRL